jgi:hypothetical protein
MTNGKEIGNITLNKTSKAFLVEAVFPEPHFEWWSGKQVQGEM